MKNVIIASILMMSSAAFADSAPPPAAPTAPCQRGQSTIKMGGMDLDVLKCQMALMKNSLGEAQEMIANLQAQNILLKEDLDKAAAPSEAPK